VSSQFRNVLLVQVGVGGKGGGRPDEYSGRLLAYGRIFGVTTSANESFEAIPPSS